MFELDHLAVAGETLEDASAHIETALGVRMQPGGQHPRYGTHNRLLGLEDGLYIEAIAIEPGVPATDRPRWFDLDRFSGPARLSNWILRCPDLPAMASALPPHAQRHVTMQRGDLRWLMTVPEDGILPFDNMFPAVLQWQGTPPASTLTPSGCRLQRLVIAHPQATDLRAALASIMTPIMAPNLAPTLNLQDGRVVIETGAPAFQAVFETPHGQRILE